MIDKRKMEVSNLYFSKDGDPIIEFNTDDGKVHGFVLKFGIPQPDDVAIKKCSMCKDYANDEYIRQTIFDRNMDFDKFLDSPISPISRQAALFLSQFRTDFPRIAPRPVDEQEFVEAVYEGEVHWTVSCAKCGRLIVTYGYGKIK